LTWASYDAEEGTSVVDVVVDVVAMGDEEVVNDALS